LEPAQLAELACRVRERAFDREETIFYCGDPGDCLYVIHQGRVRVEMPSEDGPPVILRVLQPGEFFGELALCDGKPRSATVVAMDPTRALILHREDFHRFLQSSKLAACHIITVLCARLRDTSDRLTESIFYDTASRLARRLVSLAENEGKPLPPLGPRVPGQPIEIVRPVSAEELAEMVGSTAERIRQELDNLEQDRIIRVRGDQITVLRPALLRERIQRKASVGPGSVTIPTWLLE
jgi:CRP-like cAMP-binding protein